MRMASNFWPVQEKSVAEPDPNVELTLSNMMKEMDLGASVDNPSYYDNLSPADTKKFIINRRTSALKLKQIARRAKWEEEVKIELYERDQYNLAFEGVTRKEVTSMEDQEALSRFSLTWRKGFEKERAKFLFHEVFPIISQRKKTPCHITSKEIAKLRLVSKLYKDIIDTTLSTTSTHFYEMSAGFDKKPIQNDYTYIKFKSLEKLRQFSRESIHVYRGSNPFPFRQVYLGTVDTIMDGSSMTFWVELERLLKRWGQEIWTAIYAFEIGSVELMYEFLIKYLNLMPNLRELAIIGRNPNPDKYGHRECPLIKRIEEKPLPKLNKLRSLICLQVTPASLVNALLAEYGGRLNSFSTEGRGFDKYSGKYVDFGGFVAGREYFITNYVCRYQATPMITQWDYRLPFLRKLRIDYMMVKEGVEVGNIFKTLSSLRSLRELELKIHFNVPPPMRELLPPGCMLDLPNLEYLELTVAKSKVTNVDFLLPLVALKELHFFYHYQRTESAVEGGTEVIQFVGYRNRLYDSNIWKLLPELREVNIYSLQPAIEHMIKTGYTRDEYLEHQRGPG